MTGPDESIPTARSGDGACTVGACRPCLTIATAQRSRSLQLIGGELQGILDRLDAIGASVIAIHVCQAVELIQAELVAQRLTSDATLRHRD